MDEIAQKFRVVQLTQEALKMQCKYDDYEEWGAPILKQEQYQLREKTLRETPFSKKYAIFWALVERKDGEESDNSSDVDLEAGKDALCCHCECYRFSALLRTSYGEVKHGNSYHIASVFTLPAYRSKGLATFFLTEIAKRLGALPDAIVSVLYSDIGPTYYDRLGWRLHPSQMATLDVTNNHNATLVVTTSETVGEKMYIDDALETFLQADNKRLEIEVTSLDQQQTIFAILPSRESIDWQFTNGVYYAGVYGFKELPKQCGVKVDDDAFILWCHNIKESTLYIVRARFPVNRSDQIVALLRAALTEAHKFDLKKVTIWDPSSSLLLDEAVTSQLNVVIEPRADSLSSAMIFNQKPDVSLPVWIANEKFAWV